MHTEKAINKIRKFLSTGRHSRYELAAAAGINRASFRNFDSPDWNPRAKTLLQLEAGIAQIQRPVKN